MSALLWLISLPFRIVGYVAVIAAFGAGFRDLWRSVQQDHLVLTPLGAIWYALWPDGLNALQAGIQRTLHPSLWDPAMIAYLNLPAFMALLLLAALALLIGQLIYRSR